MSLTPIQDMTSPQLFEAFWSLCDFFKKNVNSERCLVVYDAICRYSREYMRRTGIPIVVMIDCPRLVGMLKEDGLQ